MLIRAARTARHLAVRALTSHGLAHPLTLALLAAASTAAARAWDPGPPRGRDPHRTRTESPPCPLTSTPATWTPTAPGPTTPADCSTCTTTRPGCPDGIPLWERYCRLQDAYLTHLRTRGTQ
ncbi:hypothetical protein ACH4EC_38040 [Streptomyces anulatus]